MAKVTMPQLGESVAEGTIGKWLKQPGDDVAKYEPLLEVITDKVNAEVPSPVEGKLTEILVQEGATVPNNAEIAIIEEAGAGEADGRRGPAAAAPADERGRRRRRSRGPDARPAATAAPAPANGAGRLRRAPRPARGPRAGRWPQPLRPPRRPRPPGDPDARMTPAVRRLLREHGLDRGADRRDRWRRADHPRGRHRLRRAGRTGKPVGAQGSGPAARPPHRRRPHRQTGSPRRGARRAQPRSPSIEFPAGADEVLVPMTQMRKGIAAQMTRALAVPHAYVSMEVDVANLVRLRESDKRDFQAREGISLSYVPFVVKASVEALRRNPTFNAHWTDDGLLAKRRINIGVAVAVDDGLIVPVVRDVDELSIHGLNQAIADVAGRARADKLRIDDFGGGTFTVDNTGWLGSNLTMPIINVPEVGDHDDGGDHEAAGRRREPGRRLRSPSGRS